MKRAKHIIYGLFLALLLVVVIYTVFLFAVEPTNKVWRPEEGIWYCEELQIQLSFDSRYKSYAILDDQMIVCACENSRGSKDILVLCQESIAGEYEIGDLIFSGRYVDLDGNRYVVRDMITHELYTFELIE